MDKEVEPKDKKINILAEKKGSQNDITLKQMEKYI